MILTPEELEDKWRMFINNAEVANVVNVTLPKVTTKEVENVESAMNKLFDMYDKDVVKKSALENTPHETATNVYKSKKKKQEYLFISDLHIPFHLDEVDKLIDMYGNRDFDLVIAGDALDCFDISVFPKNKAVGLSNEVSIFKEMLKKCSKLFNNIYLIGGNHEARHSTYLRKRLSPEISALVGDDILENIVNSLKLPNLHYTSGDTLNWYVQIDNVIIAHPSSYKKSTLGTVLDTFNYFDARGSDATVFMIGHCFSDDTELLSPSGWVSYNSLTPDSMVATLNKDTRLIEFNKVNAIHIYDSYTELYKFKNDSMDLLVTDKHGMIYEEKRSGKLVELEAKDFDKQEGYVYVSGILDRPDLNNWTDDEIRLMVQLHIYGSKEKGKYWRFHIKKQRKVNRLYELLDRMGIEYSINLNENNIQYVYIGILPDKYTKEIPSEFINLSKRQVDILLEEWALTDGTMYSANRYQLQSSKKEVVDFLQHVCAISGHKSSVTSVNSEYYAISIRINVSKIRIASGKYNCGTIPYSGNVFCVNVDNGTLLARRNGKIILTQNTHHMGCTIYRNRTLVELPCLCSEQDYSLSGNIAYSPATNGYCVMVSNDNKVTFNDITLVQI
jgi:hypothetical protein